MYRSALRATPRAVHALRQSSLRAAPKRFASTSPADKKRSWKGSALRWGLALGAVYWYSTNPAFAEELQPQHVSPPPQFSDDDLPTIEAVVEQKRREAEARLAKESPAPKGDAAAPPAAVLGSIEGNPAQDSESEPGPAAPGQLDGPEALEAEADQQGAFNPETGEINWDCPCLGGMAHGPCGEEFKAAFSCFVYSTEEPKGMDCIDKFQHMQDCFRQHPEVYGDELAEDEEEASADGIPEAGVADAKAVSGETDAPPPPSPSPSAPSGTTAPDANPSTKDAPSETLTAEGAENKSA